MGKNNMYKLSEIPSPNYNAWEFRTCISAQLKDLLETLLDNDPEPTTSQNGKIWKACKSRNNAAAELLVNALDDDQLIHICGLETEPAKMWERLKTVLDLVPYCYIHQFFYSSSKSHLYNSFLCQGS